MVVIKACWTSLRKYFYYSIPNYQLPSDLFPLMKNEMRLNQDFRAFLHEDGLYIYTNDWNDQETIRSYLEDVYFWIDILMKFNISMH